jgi:hypothetical protein
VAIGKASVLSERVCMVGKWCGVGFWMRGVLIAKSSKEGVFIAKKRGVP